jgi:pimeloyl-ACP methyl ester carboxylesterase
MAFMPEPSPALYRAGEGEPLLLLHGFTATWPIWRPVLADLVARHEVIAPTLAGHDGGPPFEKTGELRIPDAVDSLEEHLDELGVGTAHVVGNSMGGALALELARRGRARSVVALSPAGGWRAGDAEPLRIARFFARQQRISRASAPRLPAIMRRPGARRLALRDIMRRGEQMPAADAIDLVRSSIRCTLVDRVLEALRAGRGTLDGLQDIAVPTLVAWPQFDRVLPAPLHAPRFRAEIPGVEYRVLPGTGHVPMWDDPRLCAQTIAGFVARHAGARA